MKLFHAIANYMSGFWTGELEPWLKHLGQLVSHDVVTALAPFAHEAVQELVAAGGQLLAGSAPASVLANTLVAVEATGQKAIAAGIHAAGHDLLTAVAGAIATAQVGQTVAQISPLTTATEG